MTDLRENKSTTINHTTKFQCCCFESIQPIEKKKSTLFIKRTKNVRSFCRNSRNSFNKFHFIINFYSNSCSYQQCQTATRSRLQRNIRSTLLPPNQRNRLLLPQRPKQPPPQTPHEPSQDACRHRLLLFYLFWISSSGILLHQCLVSW